jgi:hypothetical protein
METLCGDIKDSHKGILKKNLNILKITWYSNVWEFAFVLKVIRLFLGTNLKQFEANLNYVCIVWFKNDQGGLISMTKIWGLKMKTTF